MNSPVPEHWPNAWSRKNDSHLDTASEMSVAGTDLLEYFRTQLNTSSTQYAVFV